MRGAELMARTARAKSETGIYAVILKGKTDIFRSDEDYEDFIERLDDSDAEMLGFGLVHDHAFLCIKESAAGISADIRSIIIGYARYYNKKYGSTGRLFDGRFKSEPINSEAETENCVRLVQDAVNITGKDGYTSVGGDGEYEMLPFFASEMGTKKASAKRSKRADNAPEAKTSKIKAGKKKAVTDNKEAHKNTANPAVTAVQDTDGKPSPAVEPKKPEKNLPSWLL